MLNVGLLYSIRFSRRHITTVVKLKFNRKPFYLFVYFFRIICNEWLNRISPTVTFIFSKIKVLLNYYLSSLQSVQFCSPFSIMYLFVLRIQFRILYTVYYTLCTVQFVQSVYTVILFLRFSEFSAIQVASVNKTLTDKIKKWKI